MLERYLVLRSAGAGSGRLAIEVGAGPHAISTIPLAHLVGPEGRVVAVEPKRWDHFRTIVDPSGLGDRIRPVAADARRLPFNDRVADLAACIHGLRSLGDDGSVVEIFREMLRSSRRVVVAESLPDAHTDAQRAHLRMYDLREELFRATSGRTDDRHYRPITEIVSLVERAGGAVEQTATFDPDLPHALAYFPRTAFESVRNAAERSRLLTEWDAAYSDVERFGADHPPVGVVVARGSRTGSGPIPPELARR